MNRRRVKNDPARIPVRTTPVTNRPPPQLRQSESGARWTSVRITASNRLAKVKSKEEEFRSHRINNTGSRRSPVNHADAPLSDGMKNQAASEVPQTARAAMAATSQLYRNPGRLLRAKIPAAASAQTISGMRNRGKPVK
jgi:hypothetical protein